VRACSNTGPEKRPVQVSPQAIPGTLEITLPLPVPASCTFSRYEPVPFMASSSTPVFVANCTVPVRAPRARGLKRIEIVHEAPAASTAAQVLVNSKSSGFEFSTINPPTGASSWLVMIQSTLSLVVPTSRGAYSTLENDPRTVPGGPLSVTPSTTDGGGGEGPPVTAPLPAAPEAPPASSGALSPPAPPIEPSCTSCVVTERSSTEHAAMAPPTSRVAPTGKPNRVITSAAITLPLPRSSPCSFLIPTPPGRQVPSAAPPPARARRTREGLSKQSPSNNFCTCDAEGCSASPSNDRLTLRRFGDELVGLLENINVENARGLGTPLGEVRLTRQ
jgi:hypothetical protein